MFSFYSIILDVAIAVLLIFFLARSMSKGFVRTVSGLVALAAAFVGAGFVAELLSAYVAKLLQPGIFSTLMEIVGGSGGDVKVLSDVQVFGISVAETEVFKDVAGAVHSGLEQVVGAISEQVADKAAYFLVAALSFVILLVVAHMLLKLLDLASRLPGLNAVNKLMGLLAGGLKGILVVYVLVFIINTFTGYVPADVRESTFLFSVFASYNPFSFAAG